MLFVVRGPCMLTFNKLMGLGLLLGVVMVAVKIFFIRSFDWESTMTHVLFWVIGCLWAIALVRRLGVITFLEAFVVCGVWIFLSVLLDSLITASLVGYGIFLDFHFLLGYFLIIVVMFFFHKKRHVAVRRELAAKGGHH